MSQRVNKKKHFKRILAMTFKSNILGINLKRVGNMEDPILCANGCGFFGTTATRNLCSKCYRDFLKEEEESTKTKVMSMKKAMGPRVESTSSLDDEKEKNSESSANKRKPATRNLCSKCYGDYLKEEGESAKAKAMSMEKAMGPRVESTSSLDYVVTSMAQLSLSSENTNKVINGDLL
ncbi:unnamed protein product, partial [Vitis vinifera]